MKDLLSPYESDALALIHQWKEPTAGHFERAVGVLGWPAKKASDLVSKIPGMDWAIGRTIGGLVELLNNIAQWSVRSDAIYAEFRDAGLDVYSAADVLRLDLADVDRVVGRLEGKYVSLAGGEGVIAGVAGALGIPTDIVALVALNLRAIGEYATYYGFDIGVDEERVFAMNILFLATSPPERAKQKAMAQVVRIARDMSSKHAVERFQQNAFSQVIQQFAKVLGRRLTRSKFSQSLPIAGSIVGGGSNALYTSRVCKSASNLYRERFLAEKYGPELIELTVEPASDFSIDDEQY